jgi:hypothetical protein
MNPTSCLDDILNAVLTTVTNLGITEPLQNIILTSLTNNVATITTQFNHGYFVGQSIVVNDITNSTYSGTFAVTTIPEPNIFTFALVSANIASNADAGTTSGVIPCVLRKLPKKGEQIDPDILLTICKAETPEDVKFYAFGVVKVRYPIEITIISPNNMDNYTNINYYANWRQTIRLALQKPPVLNLTENTYAFDVDNTPQNFLDRREISDIYDYQQIVVWVSTIEPPSTGVVVNE